MRLAFLRFLIGTALFTVQVSAQASGTRTGSVPSVSPIVAPAPIPERVWTVGPGAGADFSVVTDALLVAADGDTLLVRPGNYSGSISIDKGIHLVADGSGPVVFAQSVHIHDVPLASRVTLSGIQFNQGFLAETCSGLLRFQECSTPDPPLHNTWPAGVAWNDGWFCNAGSSRHQVMNCRAVTFVDCTFFGASGQHGTQGNYEGFPGHHALGVENSDVALYGCLLLGGEGGQGWGSHFGVYAGAGGNGLYLSDATSTVRITDLSATGGLGGLAHPNSSHPSSVIFGCDGLDIFALNPSSITHSTHPGLRLDAPRLVRGGSPRTLIISGQPGTDVYLYTSTGTTWRPGPAHFGILHLVGLPQIQSLGTLPANGRLGWTLAPPSPATVTEFESLHMQIIGITAGSSYLSLPRQVLVIDPSL